MHSFSLRFKDIPTKYLNFSEMKFNGSELSSIAVKSHLMVFCLNVYMWVRCSALNFQKGD